MAAQQLLILLSTMAASVATAQYGVVQIGGANPGNSIVGAVNNIGKSTLPVCLPNANTCTGTTTYVFIGNGNWNMATNWLGNAIPPTVLPGGQQIFINPAEGGECILNIPQIIAAGARMDIISGKRLRVIKALTYQD